jgi:hypothetical protein
MYRSGLLAPSRGSVGSQPRPAHSIFKRDRAAAVASGEVPICPFRDRLRLDPTCHAASEDCSLSVMTRTCLTSSAICGPEPTVYGLPRPQPHANASDTLPG